MKILYFLFLSMSLFSSSIEVQKVVINCMGKDTCKYFGKNKKNLVRQYQNEKDFLRVFEMFYSKSNYKKFHFKLNEKVLYLDINERAKVKKIKISGIKRSLRKQIERNLFLEKNTYENIAVLKKDIQSIEKFLKTKGYKNSKVSFVKEKYKDGLLVHYKIEKGIQKFIKDISYSCDNNFAKSRVQTVLGGLIEKPYDKNRMIRLTEETQKVLKDLGFYFSELNVKLEGDRYRVECGDLRRVSFDFEDENNEIVKKSVYKKIRKYFSGGSRKYSEISIRRLIADFLDKKGYANRRFEIVSEVDQSDESLIHKKIILKKAERLKLKNMSIRGNKFFSTQKLKDIFDEISSDLSKKGIWEEKDYQQFIKSIKNLYIQNGFLSSKARLLMNQSKASVQIEIEEGDQTKVGSIRVVDEKKNDLEKEYEIFDLKEGDFFNPIIFSENLKELKKKMLAEGYFYSRIVSDDNEIVEYSNNNRTVNLFIQVNRSSKYEIEKFIFIGLEKTKNSVLERSLSSLKKEMLTPEAMQEVRRRISNLNLFKSIRTEILDSKSRGRDKKAVIAIKLEEKNFGSLEIAPGFRTDLGLKLGTRFTRENLLGLNQTLDIQAGVNYRLSLEDLDNHPKRQKNKFLEYSLKSSYSYPDIFKSYWDNFTTLSYSRSRLFDFDADIFRVSNSIKRDFGRHFGLTGTYSFESIEQFNASPNLNGPSDEGAFQIGSFTPSIVIDYRDNPVFPKSGFWLQLSYEIAKSFLGSQKGDNSCSFVAANCDPEVSFGKFVSRSKFYLPITSKFYLASSLSFGVQTNHATDLKPSFSESTGFIPSIKVFRLSGADLVRGFKEREINMIDSSNDISNIIIDNKAFMTNFKFEPRYVLGESIVMGLFFDAGNIQVNNYRPLDLRTSAGLSLKYVTPVGTIDVDYGFKLKRRTTIAGKESPGEFRLSIGFF